MNTKEMKRQFGFDSALEGKEHFSSNKTYNPVRKEKGLYSSGSYIPVSEGKSSLGGN